MASSFCGRKLRFQYLFLKAIVNLLLAVSCLVPVLPAYCFEADYLPLTGKHLSRRFIQNEVISTLPPASSIEHGQTHIALASSGVLTLRGLDSCGKAWFLAAETPCAAVSVWSADLDKNGKEDLIFYLPLALDKDAEARYLPSARLLIVMIENNGRPFPWTLEGYFQVDRYGVKDILDLDRNGRAEVLSQCFDDGYWISSFYQALNGRFQKLNSLDGLCLPLFTRFSRNPNHTAYSPPQYRHPHEPDRSNRLLSNYKSDFLYEKRLRADGALLLFFSSLNTSIKLSKQAFLIVDQSNGRFVCMLSCRQAASSLLSKLSRQAFQFSGCTSEKEAGQARSLDLLYCRASESGIRTPQPEVRDFSAAALSELP